MKKVCIGVMLALILATGIFAAEMDDKTTADAQELLAREQGKSDENHQFLDEHVFGSLENRQKLNEFRSRFNEVNGQIHLLKNQIAVAMRSRTPDLRSVSDKRQRLEKNVEAHDKLLSEFQQWISSIR